MKIAMVTVWYLLVGVAVLLATCRSVDWGPWRQRVACVLAWPFVVLLLGADTGMETIPAVFAVFAVALAGGLIVFGVM